MKDSTNNDHQRLPTASRQELTIEGAGCASCVTKIEAALKTVPGVVSAEMNFAQRTVTVTGDADTASADQGG